MTEIDRDRGRYLIGAGLSALLTILAFAAVALGLSRGVALGIIGVSAVAQVIVQLRCFLHIDFSRQKREDLQLILFSLLLLALTLPSRVINIDRAVNIDEPWWVISSANFYYAVTHHDFQDTFRISSRCDEYVDHLHRHAWLLP